MLTFRSVRSQLILGVTLVHSILMTLFVWDLTHRQLDILMDRQVKATQSLAQSVATSAAGWVASRDLNGLQEIVISQNRYPDFSFAMVLDKEGKVLAHTDTERRGQFIVDLPDTFTTHILSRTPDFIDVAAPVHLAGNPIGWVRVGLTNNTTRGELKSILLEGLIYGLLAIAIGAALAWYLGTQLTTKLRKIEAAAEAVEKGDITHRADVAGEDEVSHVANAFNGMLDSLRRSQSDLESSEERFTLAMQASNDGLWDWNLKTNEVYYSPRWKSMLGYKNDELENSINTWKSLVDDEGRLATLNLVEQCLAGNTNQFRIEFKMRHKQGHWVDIHSQGILIQDQEGRPHRIVGTHSDITEEKKKENIIWQQANYDDLTGLPNRKLFSELLARSLNQVKREQRKLWVLFIDLDGFKNINDTFGHSSGDELLRMVAQRIKNVTREADVAAHLSGDEFALLLSSMHDFNELDTVAQKLVDTIAQTYQLKNREIFISASIGIAGYPDNGDTVDGLIKSSDQAMYAAKKQGKNRYAYITHSLQKASDHRNQVSIDLRYAISHNEFQVFYQPIVELKNGKIKKAEALIRWSHRDKGLISPADFIPIAEESGAIGEIGAWVFRDVFRQFELWRSSIAPDFQISINMSPSQLKMAGKQYDRWLLDMKELGISGSNIVIEITEGMMLKNEPVVSDRLLEYRDAGVQVAIDDFGTGYSSLAYLKEFDIDYLKIDQSFIRNLKAGSSELTLSEAIIVMAHKLELKVIAEGVETAEQAELLKSIGCDYAQGYFYSRPIPAEDFQRNFIDDHSNGAALLTSQT